MPHNESRVARGRGEDLRGRTITSRTGGVETEPLSLLEKGIVAKQLKEDLRPREPSKPKKGSEPAPDMRDPIRGRVQHSGMYGAPTIYEEKAGGRKRGKRV